MTDSLLMIGATASNDPEQPRKLRGVYVPKKESSTHRAMFEFYKNLGKIRSLPRVAKHFGKSVPFVSTLSRAFNWQDRLQQSVQLDPVVSATSAGMDASRTKIAGFINDITDTLVEMSDLSRKIKTSVTGETEEDKKRADVLVRALSVFGVRISTPRDLRDLVAVLREIQDFKSSVPPPVPSKTTMNIEKAVIISGLDDEPKK
jgi:hypothetical protein